MKALITFSVFLMGILQAQALVISEVMSNPIGDDSGREWIEVFNDTASDTDLSTMTISIKGGSFAVTTPLQGGTVLPPGAYAVIGSIVSGTTKFLQDYPSYAGPLFKSAVSLVNSGTTSIDIKLNGSLVASLPAYAAAKEGQTLSFISGTYVVGTPTPGAENQPADVQASGSSTSTDNQTTVPQMSPPLPDVVIYMPPAKVVVAGAESEFSVFSTTHAGKPINDLRYTWAFGDGGQGVGSSTKYRYVYSGRYIAQAEAASSAVVAKGHMIVRVVPPDLTISSFGAGKYGSYVDIQNPNPYDIDLSQWVLTIDGAAFPFPRNTLLAANSTTKFSGLAMGFASTTVATSSMIKILFPNLEEVSRFIPPEGDTSSSSTKVATIPPRPSFHPQPKVLGASTSTQVSTPPANKIPQKDKRIVTWIRSLFK